MKKILIAIIFLFLFGGEFIPSTYASTNTSEVFINYQNTNGTWANPANLLGAVDNNYASTSNGSAIYFSFSSGRLRSR